MEFGQLPRGKLEVHEVKETKTEGAISQDHIFPGTARDKIKIRSSLRGRPGTLL